MLTLLKRLFTPVLQPQWGADLVFAIIRFITGMLLALDFGASKFGMPWSPKENELGLFEVAYWFPDDVASYGGIFAAFPAFFTWMGLLVKLLVAYSLPLV